jgi:hypothetical protein
VAFAVAIALALLVATVPAQAAPAEHAIKVTRLVIEPDGPDFNITVSYSTSFMTRFFSLLFGSKVIEPAIVEQLSGFGEVRLASIDPSGQTAKLVATDQAWLSNGWYVYNGGARLKTSVSRIEIRGKAIDKPIVLSNSSAIPTFFYRP